MRPPAHSWGGTVAVLPPHPGKISSSRVGLAADELRMNEGDAMPQEEPNWTKRRRFQRVSTDAPVRISTIEPERDPWTGRPFFRASQETCANVSRGGAFVKTCEPLDPGRRLLVEVHLPTGVPLEAIGRVAWTKRVMTPHARAAESGIGIEFIGGASDQFAALEDYILALADRASESENRTASEPEDAGGGNPA